MTSKHQKNKSIRLKGCPVPHKRSKPYLTSDADSQKDKLVEKDMKAIGKRSSDILKDIFKWGTK